MTTNHGNYGMPFPNVRTHQEMWRTAIHVVALACRGRFRRNPTRCFSVWLLTALSGATLAQSPGRYEIDPQESEIHWRIYKAGAFSRFGHNHVIAVAAPSGAIEVAERMSESSISIEFAVDELIIDEPELRAKYGEDFASEPTDEDIAGTRSNMLTEQVLNGDVFPTISVTGTGLSDIGENQMIELTMSLLGRGVELTVPVDVSFDGNHLRAQSEFRLLHSELGMEPFSVMMGALQVAPEIDFTVDIRAKARDVLK